MWSLRSGLDLSGEEWVRCFETSLVQPELGVAAGIIGPRPDCGGSVAPWKRQVSKFDRGTNRESRADPSSGACLVTDPPLLDGNGGPRLRILRRGQHTSVLLSLFDRDDIALPPRPPLEGGGRRRLSCVERHLPRR